MVKLMQHKAILLILEAVNKIISDQCELRTIHQVQPLLEAIQELVESVEENESTNGQQARP